MNTKKGFTLLDMLIVIAIIAIFVGIVMVVIEERQEKETPLPPEITQMTTQRFDTEFAKCEAFNLLPTEICVICENGDIECFDVEVPEVQPIE